MKSNIPERIYWRELGDRRPYSGVKGLYGDKAWAQNLDIVNELGGHTGCVNALRFVRDAATHLMLRGQGLIMPAVGQNQGNFLPRARTIRTC